jgi:ribonuclease E
MTPEEEASASEASEEGEDAAPAALVTEAVVEETVQADAGEEAVAEAQAPAPAKPRRSRKKAAPAAEPTVEAVPAEDADAAPAISEGVIAPQVDAALGEEPQAPEAAPETEQDNEEAKPVRANRASNISSSDPVIKSSEPASQEPSDREETKPKKAGWWQRRGFF